MFWILDLNVTPHNHKPIALSFVLSNSHVRVAGISLSSLPQICGSNSSGVSIGCRFYSSSQSSCRCCHDMPASTSSWENRLEYREAKIWKILRSWKYFVASNNASFFGILLTPPPINLRLSPGVWDATFWQWKREVEFWCYGDARGPW